MKPRRIIEHEVEFTRAGGQCVCSICGHPYAEHEVVEVAKTWVDNPLLLWQLCDGRFVKL